MKVGIQLIGAGVAGLVLYDLVLKPKSPFTVGAVKAAQTSTAPTAAQYLAQFQGIAAALLKANQATPNAATNAAQQAAQKSSGGGSSGGGAPGGGSSGGGTPQKPAQTGATPDQDVTQFGPTPEEIDAAMAAQTAADLAAGNTADDLDAAANGTLDLTGIDLSGGLGLPDLSSVDEDPGVTFGGGDEQGIDDGFEDFGGGD